MWIFLFHLALALLGFCHQASKKRRIRFFGFKMCWLEGQRRQGSKEGALCSHSRPSFPQQHRVRRPPLTSFFALRTTFQTYLSAKVYSVTYPSWRALSSLPRCLLDGSPTSLMLSRKGTHDRQIRVFKQPQEEEVTCSHGPGFFFLWVCFLFLKPGS